MNADQKTRETLVEGLVRIGEQAIAREDEAALAAYYAADFVFHGPGGDQDFQGLRTYFAALRAAFDDLTVTRDHIVVEGDFVACQTAIAGTFMSEFTHSPVGPLPPTGRSVVFDLINIFRYDDGGRLAEEWVQTDVRSTLRQLGAEGR